MNRKERRFNERETVILEQAESLIKAKGYARFTMDEVAESADVAKGTLYLHFKSKEELVYRLVEPKLLELESAVDERVEAEVAFSDKVRTLIAELLSSRFFQFAVRSFPDMGAVFQEDNEKQLETVQEKIVTRLVALVQHNGSLLRPGVPPRFAALQFMQIMDPLIYEDLVIRGGMEHDEFVRCTAEHFLRGVLVAAPASETFATDTAITMETADAWVERSNEQDVEGLCAVTSSRLEIIGPRGKGTIDHRQLGDWVKRANVRLETVERYGKGAFAVLRQQGTWLNSDDTVKGELEVYTVLKVAERQVCFLARYETKEEAFETSGLEERDKFVPGI